MSAHAEHLEPVGGPILTKPFKVLAGVFMLAMVLVLWRFVVGLGPSTGLNDGFAWGAWKVFNVIVLTALASGGYAMALLVYVLNKGKLHGLARTAIITSALGYTTGVIALGVDIGRPWNFYRIVGVWDWNLHSVLLEVAVCISVYLIFLWLEAAPPFLEVWRKEGPGKLKEYAIKLTPIIEKYYAWIVAMAVLLPSMHQSSLGSLMLLAGPRLHPLWQTPILPLEFLLSCWVLGWSCVVLVSMLSSWAYKRPLEMPMLSALSKVMSYVTLVFLAVRVVDVVVRGQMGAALAMDRFSFLFFAELILLAIPAVLLLNAGSRNDPRVLFQLMMLVVMGGSLYRLNTGLVAFMPGDHWSYFPTVVELVITFGFMALAVIGYLAIVKLFPILTAAPSAHAHART